MATKAELQRDSDEYERLERLMLEAADRGDFMEAMSHARKSWEYVSGMMQFEVRYENKTFKHIKTIQWALRWAPALIESEALSELSAVLKDNKRIDKVADADLAAELDESITRLAIVVDLWSLLEDGEPRDITQLSSRLQKDTEWAKRLVDDLISLGVVEQFGKGRQTRYQLTTDKRMVIMRCLTCGAEFRRDLFAAMTNDECSTCAKPTQHLWLSAVNITEAGE
jgi:predicted transcriptional regulator